MSRPSSSFFRSLLGVWQDSWREHVIERAPDSARDLVFVAEEHGKIVGFAFAYDMGFRAFVANSD
jgi:hypothetical protein